ncbi:hypothetical protein KCU96_g23236, partial [Aureobasidium melanogenum]
LSQNGESNAANAAGIAGNRELVDEISKVEDELRRRLPIGYTASLATLRREFVDRKNFSEQALNRAIWALQKRDSIQLRKGGGQVYRSGV